MVGNNEGFMSYREREREKERERERKQERSMRSTIKFHSLDSESQMSKSDGKKRRERRKGMGGRKNSILFQLVSVQNLLNL